jgi:hypothetical protein
VRRDSREAGRGHVVAAASVLRGRDLDLLASLVPALALHHLVTWGDIPGAGPAQQITDEVISPLATAPPGSTQPASAPPPDAPRRIP